MKDIKRRKQWFLITIWLLLIFAVAGQIGIDKICLASERGQYYGYERCLPNLGITIAVTCAAIGLVFLAVRFFPVKRIVLNVIAWVLGFAMAGWMLFCTGMTIYRATDSGDVYGAAGLWIAYVDKLEEERMVWSKSHWFGHGDDVYKYSYDEFVEAHSHLSLGHEEKEPYNSILDERYKQEYVFEYLHSDTMINVLSYFYGRWVWLIYLLMALSSVALAISLLPLAGRLPGKLLYCAGWVLFAEIALLPALNGCALVYDPVAGPLFTGVGTYYWQYGAMFAGPAIGVLLGLTCRKIEKSPMLPNEDEDSSTVEENVPLIKEVLLPDSMRKISNKAFENCIRLVKMSFNDGIEYIGEDAYKGCKSLKELSIPNSVTFIGDGAFCFCENLESVDLPDWLEKIGANTFLHCHKLKRVVLPGFLKKIGRCAFTYCSELEKIIIPNSVNEIGEDAFRYCEKLSLIYLDNPDLLYGTAYRGNAKILPLKEAEKNHISGR